MKLINVDVGTYDQVEVVKSFIKWHIENRIPVSLVQAREYYEDAGLPIPNQLQPKNWTEEELLEADKSEDLIFRVYLKE